MPYSNIRKVVDVEVPSWTEEGEYHEDTQYYIDYIYVVATCDTGEKFVHEVVFSNETYSKEAGDRANRLADRVMERGYINLKHWGFHEYFSLTLEQKLNQEAIYEDMHRKGYGHEVTSPFWGGIA